MNGGENHDRYGVHVLHDVSLYASLSWHARIRSALRRHSVQAEHPRGLRFHYGQESFACRYAKCKPAGLLFPAASFRREAETGTDLRKAI